MESDKAGIGGAPEVYAATQGRLFMSPGLARRHATAHWLYRLTFNGAVEAERAFSRHRRRQVLLGYEPPKRPSVYDLNMALPSLRADDAAGPALPEASLFPVTLLRAAVREVHDATTNTIKRWAAGERASLPRFRSADDAQTIKISAFALRRSDRFDACAGGADDGKLAHNGAGARGEGEVDGGRGSAGDHSGVAAASVPVPYGPPVPPRFIERPVMTFFVKGLGKLKARLSRPLPPGHVPVELHLTRHPDGRAEMRVVSRGPAPAPIFDAAEIGRRLHEAVRQLPEEAPNLAYVRAVQDAGIVARGGDVGLLAPVASSDGLATLPVRRGRAEVEAVKAHQREEAKRKRGRKRTKQAEALRKRAAQAQRRSAARRKTRALQDAAMIARGIGPGPGHPFLRPYAGTCAGRDADSDAGTCNRGSIPVPARAPAALTVMECRRVERGVVERGVQEREEAPEAWQRRRARATVRRIAETGMGLRIRRTAALSRAQGGIAIEVEPRGSTRECAACGADVPKGLGERTHRCPGCGFTTDRDDNATLNILGRGLRRFWDSPDPGGEIAAATGAAAKALAKRAHKAEARRKGGQTRAARYKAKTTRGVVAPGLEHQVDHDTGSS